MVDDGQNSPRQQRENGAENAQQSGASPSQPETVSTREPTAGELAIVRILSSWNDKNYFSLLQLPEPEADELGRPTWSCTASDVSRAYRRMSVLVHPDKHPGNEDARQAFEALKETHKILTDRGTLEEALKSKLPEAILRRERNKAAASLDERIVMAAEEHKRAQELLKEEKRKMTSEIMEQMMKKKMRGQWKKNLHARKREQEAEEEDDDEKEQAKEAGDEDEEDDGVNRPAKKHKKKLRTIF